MTDEEYREFLSALARKHLRERRWRRHFGPDGGEHLRYEIDRAASTARFVKVAMDRVGDQELLNLLAKELSHTYVSNITHAMEESGVLDALEEAPDITFRELRRTAIPDEDLELRASPESASPKPRSRSSSTTSASTSALPTLGPLRSPSVHTTSSSTPHRCSRAESRARAISLRRRSGSCSTGWARF